MISLKFNNSLNYHSSLTFLGRPGKKMFVSFMYYQNAGFDAKRFSSNGTPETNLSRRVIVKGLNTVQKPLGRAKRQRPHQSRASPKQLGCLVYRQTPVLRMEPLGLLVLSRNACSYESATVSKMNPVIKSPIPTQSKIVSYLSLLLFINTWRQEPLIRTLKSACIMNTYRKAIK